MNKFEIDYKEILKDVLENGVQSSNRTGIPTRRRFNRQLTINLQQGFPIVTGKKTWFEKGKAEFEWIWEGRTDLAYLNERGVNWWNDFSTDGETIGKSYGYQLRYFGGHFDQISFACTQINKGSRRAVISLWDPTEVAKNEILPPCYTQFIFYKDLDKLNMHVTFRSSDLFLGLPYDIIFCALMLHRVANNCQLKANEISLTLVDAHIYTNHIEQVKEYLGRRWHSLPKLDQNNLTLSKYNTGSYIPATLNGTFNK